MYAVGGWADGYSNAVPRLVEGLSGPRKGLIGPWSHAFPQDGEPGPAIGFLQECLRWFDHWLKGIDTKIMDEPALRAWMQERCHRPPINSARALGDRRSLAPPGNEQRCGPRGRFPSSTAESRRPRRGGLVSTAARATGRRAEREDER